MSFFLHLFAPLLAGAAAPTATTPPQKAPPRFGVPNFHATGQFSHQVGLTGNFSSPASLALKKSTTPTPTRSLEFAERFYGLGLLIAKAIGLRARLGFLSRPAIAGVKDTCPRNGTVAPHDFLTPDSSSFSHLLITPGDEPRRPHFARATPPNLQWRFPLHTQASPVLGPYGALFPFPPPPVIEPVVPKYADQGVDSLPPLTTLPVPFDYFRDSEISARISFLPDQDQFASSQALGIGQPPVAYADDQHFGGPEEYESNLNLANYPNDSVAVPATGGSSVEYEGWPSARPRNSEGSDHSDESIASDMAEAILAAEDPYNTDKEARPDTVTHNGSTYYILGSLGEGSFGRVMLALNHAGQSVALKVVHKRVVYRTDPTVKDNLARERDCMLWASKENLLYWVKLQAAWEDDHNIYYAMDLCLGSLRHYMAEAKFDLDGVDERELKLMCAEMLLAILDLREHHIVHGDIKPDNFLISSSGRVLLADFGMAQWPSADYVRDEREFLAWRGRPGGTPGYMAPECIEEYDGYLSHKSDIYSLGLVFMEIMSNGRCNPIWDTVEVPDGLPGGAALWDCMPSAARQRWLSTKVGFDKVELARDSVEWDLCMQMIHRRRPIKNLMEHPYFDGINFEHIRNGWHAHNCRMTMRRPNVHRDKRDIMFEAWHRGEAPTETYGGHEVVFRTLKNKNGVFRTKWLVDCWEVKKAMREPLPDFTWPPAAPPGLTKPANSVGEHSGWGSQYFDVPMRSVVWDDSDGRTAV